MADTALIPAIAPVLTVVDGIPTTTSADVARHFGKRHEHVMDSIRGLLAQLPENAHPNFRVSEYTDPTGRKLPAYVLSRDGFTLLAMGFTGKKALSFKLAYIDAFNRMEVRLHTADPERVKLAQSIAAEVAAAASRAVFEAVLAGGNFNWELDRWLFSFGYGRDGKPAPSAKPIAREAMVVTAKKPEKELPAGSVIS